MADKLCKIPIADLEAFAAAVGIINRVLVNNFDAKLQIKKIVVKPLFCIDFENNFPYDSVDG